MYVPLPSLPTVANVAHSFVELHFIYAILNDLVEIISQESEPWDYFPTEIFYVNNPG